MRFSVLTPTFNRATLLTETYKSLCAQTFHDFEWVVVDDGSTDGTRELVASWKPFFPIRYEWKPNGGMHTALNRGAEIATGELVTQLDSDDRYLPRALDCFDQHWQNIPDPDKFSQVAALCFQADGTTLLGSQLPRQEIDTFNLRDGLVLIDADRCSICRADIYRRFRYPEFPNERFLNPGVVINRMLKKYAVRWVNEPLKIVGYAPGHMSVRDLRWSSPRGAVLFHTELALSNVPLKVRLKSALNTIRFAPVAAVAIVRSH
jgi:glycosyltransferase involved in cell wall biosynthesis